jgi:hypothetical protein
MLNQSSVTWQSRQYIRPAQHPLRTQQVASSFIIQDFRTISLSFFPLYSVPVLNFIDYTRRIDTIYWKNTTSSFVTSYTITPVHTISTIHYYDNPKLFVEFVSRLHLKNILINSWPDSVSNYTDRATTACRQS